MAKILIVDDEVEICEFLSEFFMERDYDVSTANSGEEALTLLSFNRPDIVLLDMKMQGMDGIVTLKKIKDFDKNIRVIMVTAVETVDKVNEAFALGADNYITKPLSLEYLEAEVKSKIES